MLNKKTLIIFSSVVILVLAIVVSIFTFTDRNLEKSWSVVYLASGEIYIGKISQPTIFRLKELQLSGDAYVLQVIKTRTEGEEPQTNFQLTPIKDSLWAPEKLYLNREQIVFFGPVLETSKVGEAIKEAGKW